MDASSDKDLKECLVHIIHLLHENKRLLPYDKLLEAMLSTSPRIQSVIGRTDDSDCIPLLGFLSEHRELFYLIAAESEFYVALSSRFAYIYSRLMWPLADEMVAAEENARDHFLPGKFGLDKKAYAREKVKLACIQSVHEIFAIVTTVLKRSNPVALAKLVGHFNKFSDTTRLVISYCDGRTLAEKVETLLKYFSKGLSIVNEVVSMDVKEAVALESMLELDLFFSYSKVMIMTGIEDVVELEKKFEERKFSTLPELSRQNIISMLKKQSATFFSPDDYAVKLIDGDIDMNSKHVTDVIDSFVAILKENQGSIRWKKTTIHLAIREPGLFADLRDKTSLGICQLLHLRSDVFSIQSGEIHLRPTNNRNFVYLKKSGLHAMEVDCQPSPKDKTASELLVNEPQVEVQTGVWKEIAVRSAIIEADFKSEQMEKVEVYCHSDFTIYSEDTILDFTQIFEMGQMITCHCQYNPDTTPERPRNWIATLIYSYQEEREDIMKQKEEYLKALATAKSSSTNRLINRPEIATETSDFSLYSSPSTLKKKRKKWRPNRNTKTRAEVNPSSENETEAQPEKTSSIQSAEGVLKETPCVLPETDITAQTSEKSFSATAVSFDTSENAEGGDELKQTIPIDILSLITSHSAADIASNDEIELHEHSVEEVVKLLERSSEDAGVVIKSTEEVPEREEFLQLTEKHSEDEASEIVHSLSATNVIPKDESEQMLSTAKEEALSAADITSNDDNEQQQQQQQSITEGLRLMKKISEDSVSKPSQQVSEEEVLQFVENRSEDTAATLEESPEEVSSNSYRHLLQLPLRSGEGVPKVNEIKFVLKIIRGETTQCDNLEICMFPSVVAEEQRAWEGSRAREQSTKEIHFEDVTSHEEDPTSVKMNTGLQKQHEEMERRKKGGGRETSSLTKTEIPATASDDESGDATEHVRGCPKRLKLTKRTTRAANCESCEKIKSSLDPLRAKQIAELFFFLTEPKFMYLGVDTPIENADSLLLKATFRIPSNFPNTKPTFLSSRQIEIPREILDEVKRDYLRGKASS